ncbi:MAG: SCO family protein [Alphaproteobacteria bacterium]|nr:SCO family protein [Alphaproteobacteria bacterium]
MFADYRFRAAAILLLAAIVGGSALLVSWLRSPEVAGAHIGGPFELIDQTGRRVTDGDFRGKLMLIYFGFVFCPDACPTALQNMADAVDLLGPAGEDVVPVFITIDPDRDTVEVLTDYAEAFHPRLKALTGTPEEIAKAAKAYRVFYRKADESAPGEYLVDHSSIVFLMGRDGRYLTHFTHMTLPEPMAAEIKKRL